MLKRDEGRRDELTTSDRERLKALERENRELKRANEILRTASDPGGARPPSDGPVLDDNKHRFGVEPICRVLPIAQSPYCEMKAREREAERRPPRVIRDEQLKREGFRVARCTVARLMRAMGLRRVVRGRKIKTTLAADVDVRLLDRVNHDLAVSEPNRLWVADLSYIATWCGFVYVAFVIDAFARRICQLVGVEFLAREHRVGCAQAGAL